MGTLPSVHAHGVLLTNKKRVILALRLLILALLVLIAFLNRTVEQVPVQIYLFLAIYSATIFIGAFLHLRNFLSARASTWLFVFDVFVILLTSFYLGQKHPEFYFVFLIAVMSAAAGKNIRVVFVTTVLVSVIYGFFSSVGRTGVDLFSTHFFIHIILFYIMAIFSTYLIHEADSERVEKEKTQRLLTTQMSHLAEHLENILQSINIGILILDDEGRVSTLNRRAEEILEIRSQDLWRHRLEEFPALADLVARRDEVKKDTTRFKNPAARKEISYRTQDGKMMTLGLSLARLKDLGGKATGTIYCFQDITMIREVERRMAQQERVSTVAQLASGMAHEFYNLLGGVQGMLDMAVKEDDIGEIREAITASSHALKRAFHLIQNLLAFSREREPSMARCRLREVIEEALTLVRHELEKGRIQVVTRYSSEPEIWGDSHQLGQVFLNLIINARHAMADGGTLTISMREDDRESVVEVNDTGCGIPREHLDKIFMPFFTTKGALGGSKIPGTGLGLTVSRAIIEKHGGTLVVDSDVGKGSTFTVRLSPGSR